MSKLDDLSTVIDGPGDYATRDGRRVAIYDISGNGTFAARGAVWKMFRGKMRPHGYSIWHVSGRHGALRETGADIVARL